MHMIVPSNEVVVCLYAASAGYYIMKLVCNVCDDTL